jgi:hypothetical protein
MFTLRTEIDIPAAAETILRSLVASIPQEEINAMVGQAAVDLTRAHLRDLANTRHRASVALNFYEDAADATTFRDAGDGVELVIAKTGVGQRYHGGDISAVNHSHLWIPIEGSEAEGKSAGEFSGLIPLINPLTNRGVAIDKKTGDALFALVQSVHQDPDPTVLPTDEEYGDAILQVLTDLVDSRLADACEESQSQGGFEL